MKSKRQTYTKSFKENAINIVNSGEKTLREVANELGINVSMLRRWIKESEVGNAFPGQGRTKQNDDVIALLEEEIKRLKQENKILKQAAIVFARNQD